uniref:Domain of unknown function DB domain-containing protein n=1 Tax=Plectus sambesii TaxID=2011161 RepID=A0A914UM76_9BILA
MICILILISLNIIAVHAQAPWNWRQSQVDAAVLGASIDAFQRQFEADKARQTLPLSGQNGDGSSIVSSFIQRDSSLQSPSSLSPLGNHFPSHNIRTQQGNRLVRQCSCDETSLCFDQLKIQTFQCSGNCMFNFNPVTNRPQDLGKCFEGQGDLMDYYMQCFKTQIKDRAGCVSTTNGPMIPWQNSSELFNRELIINLNSDNPWEKLLLGILKNVFNCAKGFVNCVKQCINEKTASGVCLDQFGCQPLLPTESNGNEMLHSCSKNFSLKKDAQEMCTCAVNAGLSDLTFYCPFIGIMDSGRK